MEKDIELLVLDPKKDLPEVFLWAPKECPTLWFGSKDPTPENAVKIPTMWPKWNKTSTLSHYDEYWFSEETFLIIEEIFKKIPSDFIENLEKKMVDFCDKKNAKEMYNMGEEFVAVMMEVRSCVENEVSMCLRDLPYENKYKNLVIGMVRYRIGYKVRDLSGD